MTKFNIYRPTIAFLDKMGRHGDTPQEEARALWRDKTGYGNTQKAIEANRKLMERGDLIIGATITTTLDKFFERTNSISSSWLDNQEVADINNDAFLSSSSVGDVFSDDSGQFYLITSTTFEKISL